MLKSPLKFATKLMLKVTSCFIQALWSRLDIMKILADNDCQTPELGRVTWNLTRSPELNLHPKAERAPEASDTDNSTGAQRR